MGKGEAVTYYPGADGGLALELPDYLRDKRGCYEVNVYPKVEQATQPRLVKAPVGPDANELMNGTCGRPVQKVNAIALAIVAPCGPLDVPFCALCAPALLTRPSHPPERSLCFHATTRWNLRMLKPYYALFDEFGTHWQDYAKYGSRYGLKTIIKDSSLFSLEKKGFKTEVWGKSPLAAPGPHACRVCVVLLSLSVHRPPYACVRSTAPLVHSPPGRTRPVWGMA